MREQLSLLALQSELSSKEFEEAREYLQSSGPMWLTTIAALGKSIDDIEEQALRLRHTFCNWCVLLSAFKFAKETGFLENEIPDQVISDARLFTKFQEGNEFIQARFFELVAQLSLGTDDHIIYQVEPLDDLRPVCSEILRIAAGSAMEREVWRFADAVNKRTSSNVTVDEVRSRVDDVLLDTMSGKRIPDELRLENPDDLNVVSFIEDYIHWIALSCDLNDVVNSVDTELQFRLEGPLAQFVIPWYGSMNEETISGLRGIAEVLAEYDIVESNLVDISLGFATEMYDATHIPA